VDPWAFADGVVKHFRLRGKEAADPLLLWFQEDGSAVPKFPREVSPLFNGRALVSIGVYNLNDVRVKEARFLIALKIKRNVEWAEKYLNKALEGDESAYDHFRRVCDVLLELIAPEAEFSVAARAFLAAYRDKEWIDSALRHT